MKQIAKAIGYVGVLIRQPWLAQQTAQRSRQVQEKIEILRSTVWFDRQPQHRPAIPVIVIRRNRQLIKPLCRCPASRLTKPHQNLNPLATETKTPRCLKPFAKLHIKDLKPGGDRN